jgi:anaphase-promoting complex subunit 6
MEEANQVFEKYRDSLLQKSDEKDDFYLYISGLVLGFDCKKLYALSNLLVARLPEDECTAYCIGCYYWTINKLDLAIKYVKKAIKKNREFAIGWILLGHIFSANEESEQSLASYRSAVRLKPSHKVPLICIGRELTRGGNFWLAGHMLNAAIRLDPQDTLALNELGIIAYRIGNIHDSLNIFSSVVSFAESFELEVSYLDSLIMQT